MEWFSQKTSIAGYQPRGNFTATPCRSGFGLAAARSSWGARREADGVSDFGDGAFTCAVILIGSAGLDSDYH